MEPTITVALIMAFATIVTQLVIAAVNKKSTTEVINLKIDNLEKEVKKHNRLVERMYKCESRITVLEENKE